MKFSALCFVAFGALAVQGISLDKMRTPDSAKGDNVYSKVDNDKVSKGTVTGHNQARAMSEAEHKQVDSMLATKAEREQLNRVAMDQKPPPDNIHWARNHDAGIARTGFNDYYGDEFVNIAHPHPSVPPHSEQGAMQAHWTGMKPPPDNIHWARNQRTGLARTGFNDYYGPNHAAFSDHKGEDNPHWQSATDHNCVWYGNHKDECDQESSQMCQRSCPSAAGELNPEGHVKSSRGL